MGEGLLEVGELGLGRGELILEIGDLVLVGADLLIQLRVVLFIEKIARLDDVARGHIDLGDLRGGGHGGGLAVGREGHTGARNGGGKAPGGEGLGERRGGLRGGEELVEGESPGGQHRQRRKKEQALWERSALPGGFRSGRGVRREGCELHTFSLLFFNSFLV